MSIQPIGFFFGFRVSLMHKQVLALKEIFGFCHFFTAKLSFIVPASATPKEVSGSTKFSCQLFEYFMLPNHLNLKNSY